MNSENITKLKDCLISDRLQRMDAIDSLRGIAVLGILLLNITGFGLPSGSGSDPFLVKHEGINFYFWYIFGHGVFEGSFRAIFSMLFGASTLILISRLEQRMNSQLPTEYFVRRQLWLLLFGMFNAFVLLWPGDILFHYAVCGLVLLAFRSISPKSLVIASVCCLFVLVSIQNKDFYIEKHAILKGEAAALVDTNVNKLTWVQKESIAKMNALKNRYNSKNRHEIIENQINTFRSGYFTLFKYQADKSVSAQTYGLYYFHFFDVLAFMFLGMAFFKLGILQGDYNIKIYGWMAFIGLSAGLSLSYLYLCPAMVNNFDNYEAIKYKSVELYELQRYVRSIGIFGLIMLLYKSNWVTCFFEWVRPVGRMAFTNYLSQSVICGLIFYGFGFGMFGRLELYEMYCIVLAIWVVQIICSHIWLRYFLYGPIEWLWRSLTYWEIQPMIKSRLHFVL